MRDSANINLRKFLGIGSSLTDHMSGLSYQLRNEGAKKEGLQDPTYSGFTLKFDFENNDYRNAPAGMPNAGSIMTGLLLPETDINSAINYLIRINRPQLAANIKEFREQLKNIEENKPWYFQTLGGLGDVMKPLDPGVNWRGKDKLLSIDCLETFDMQMSFLADLYRKASFDFHANKTILPADKRKFTLKVIVSELRDLKQTERLIQTGTQIINNLNTQNSNTGKAAPYQTDAIGNNYTDDQKNLLNDVKWINRSLAEYMTFQIFTFYGCQFIFDSFPYLDSLQNNTLTPAVNTFKFSISFDHVIEYSQFGFYEWILAENRLLQAAPRSYVTNYNLKFYNDSKNDWQHWTNPKNYSDEQLLQVRLKKEADLKSLTNDKQDGVAQYYGGSDGVLRYKAGQAIGDSSGAQVLSDLKTEAAFEIMKNMFSDLTGSEVGKTNDLETKENAYSESKSNKMTEKDILYGAIRKESALDPMSRGWKNVGEGYDDNSIDTKYERERSYLKSTLKIPKYKTYSDNSILPNMDLQKVEHKEAPDDLVGSKKYYGGPEQPYVINIDLQNAGHREIIDRIELTGGEHLDEIRPIEFKKSEPIKDIARIKLEGAPALKDIARISLEGASPMKGPNGITLEGATPMKGPSSITLEGAPPMKGPHGITLKGTPPMKGPNGIILEGASPMKGPNGITLEGASPMKGPNGITLEGAKPRKDMNAIQFKKTNPMTDIKKIELKETEPSISMTKIKLEGATMNQKIQPIILEGVSARKDMQSIKLEGASPRTKMDQIEFESAKVLQSRDITAVGLEGASPRIDITKKIELKDAGHLEKMQPITLEETKPLKDITPKNLDLKSMKSNNEINPKNVFNS